MKRKKIRVDLEKLIKSLSKCRPYSLTDWKTDKDVSLIKLLLQECEEESK